MFLPVSALRKVAHPKKIGWVISLDQWAQIRYLCGRGLSIRKIAADEASFSIHGNVLVALARLRRSEAAALRIADKLGDPNYAVA